MFLHGKEADGPRIETWHLGKMLKHLEASGDIARMDLVQLEFGLFPILEYGDAKGPKILYEAIPTEPELFNELIRMVYKRRHGETEELRS